MKIVSVEALEAKGYTNPEATFKAVAQAGGFGNVSPLHEGGLDVAGIEDKAAKAAVEKILAEGLKKPNASNGNAQ